MQYELTPENPAYPTQLKEIPDAPKSLYVKGSLESSIFDFCIAVVGSRKMSSYGLRVVRHIVGKFCEVGITVVSGFMYGVDMAAHKVAVETGAKTIAVMPCGIDAVFPRRFLKFYNEMLNAGNIVVSEYAGDMSPKKWTFPRRNRIVAGLSHGVLVIEAAYNSGSLITAKLALDYNRRVYAVPGNIFSDVSRGANGLIASGAMPVGNISHILKDFGVDLELVSVKSSSAVDIDIYALLFRELNSGPATMSDLQLITGLGAETLSTYLVKLEMQQKVICRAGYYYAC